MSPALNIVVVDDDSPLLASVVEALMQDGHAARGIGCAEDLNDEDAGKPIDLLILDLDLPGETGASLANRIRAVQPNVGIIMMSGRKTAAGRVIGYQSGADIVLPKPLSINELCAAVGALMRRTARTAERLTVNQSNDNASNELSGTATGYLDQHSLHLSYQNQVVLLSLREAKLLLALARAPHRQLETWQVMQTQSDDESYSKGALEVTITRLRKKLASIGFEGPGIQALRGYGYALCFNVQIG